MVYSSGTKESTCVTSFEHWRRDLLDASRLKVGGDDGGGDAGCRDGAGVDVQREHLHAALLLFPGISPELEKPAR